MEQDLASSGAIHHHVFRGYINAFFYLCFYKNLLIILDLEGSSAAAGP